jgi:hypothetical protein
MFAASTRRYYTDHPSVTHQLHGGGAPKPTPTSNEEALIKEKMRTFPDQHPSLGSVANAIATGCPAIVHNQMDSSQWKSTYQATINESQPTLPKRRCARVRKRKRATEHARWGLPYASHAREL